MIITLFDRYKESDLINKMWVAARTCYSANNIRDLKIEAENLTIEEKLDLIKKVFKSGHLSIAEHISFTFGISGISRSCSHQLVRNRIASYSQASQRYINFSDKSFDFVTPPEIDKNPELLEEYINFMNLCKEKYDKFVKAGIKAEDARFVLPNAACTNISMTMNLRELMHVMGLRLCSRAQWEIRQVFQEMQKQTIEQYPFLKEYLQPNCEQLGFCPEGHGACGRKPKKSELIELYKESQKEDK